MKELTMIEAANVSGAGKFANLMGGVGLTIGGVMQIFGWKNAKVNTQSIGQNMGLSIEYGFSAMKSVINLLIRKEPKAMVE